MHRRTFIAGLALAPAAAAETDVPQPVAVNLGTASSRHWNGRDFPAVDLTQAEQRLRLETTGGGNRPSFALVHPAFTDGVLEVGIAGELSGRGAPDDRGFVGLSFHITPDLSSHETVYLRMTNGRLNARPPPMPRIERAIQYVADPGFHFSESRERFPGHYEKGADIAVGRWHRLRLEIAGPQLRASVDGTEALVVEDL